MWRNQSVHIPSDIQEFVTFTGHVKSSDLSKIMGSAFALVYPPYFEGFGIPLVEAMKSGIPIVSSNQTCLRNSLVMQPFILTRLMQRRWLNKC